MKNYRIAVTLFLVLSFFAFAGQRPLNASEKVKIDRQFLIELQGLNECVTIILEWKDEPLVAYAERFDQYYTPFHGDYHMALSHYRDQLERKQKLMIQQLIRANFSFNYTYFYTEVLNGVALSIPSNEVERLLDLSYVRYITDAREQWGSYRRIAALNTGVRDVWFGDRTQRASGKGITIGIIDSGIDASHPEFKDKVKGGACYTGSGRHDTDSQLHGTHVAGIAAGLGLTNDDRGMAFDADLMSYKVFSASEIGASSDRIIKAIDQSVKDGCQVINLSLGSPGGGRESVGETAYYRAIHLADQAGVFVVAASGNSGSRSSDIPWVAGTPSIIKEAFAVAASNDRSPDPTIANFSSMGITPDAAFKPEISAPGVDIMSTIPERYGRSHYPASGTSMAAPVIAGIVALIKELHPTWTHNQIKSSLMNTADLIMNTHNQLPLSFTLQGAGQANVKNALNTPAFIKPQAIVGENINKSFSRDIQVHATKDLTLSPQIELFVEKGEELPFNIEIEPNRMQLRKDAKGSFQLQISPKEMGNQIFRSRYEGVVWMGDLHIPFILYRSTVEDENIEATRRIVSDIQLSANSFHYALDADAEISMQVVFSLNTGDEISFQDDKFNSNFGSVQVYLSDKHGTIWSRRPLFEIQRAPVGYYSFYWDGIASDLDYIPDGEYALMFVTSAESRDDILSPSFSFFDHSETPWANAILSSNRTIRNQQEAEIHLYWDFYEKPVEQFEITIRHDERRMQDLEVELHPFPFDHKQPIIRRNSVKLEWEGRWRSNMENQRFKVATLRFQASGIGAIDLSARPLIRDQRRRNLMVYPYIPEITISRRDFLLSDFNEDRKVDIQDLVLFSKHYMPDRICRESYDSRFDLNQNRRIDENDLAILLNEFGTCLNDS